MSDFAVQVEGLSKQYRIGERVERYYTLRDSLSELAARYAGLFSRNGQNTTTGTLFWALKDVSFDVKRGEVIGIIGRNGAGKTTLLKILSRITEPTEGRAEIHGRVSSLLAVGTGFHPELTGRENIYLNGAILGMKRAETNRKFDEIVAFSEVEKFIDTPVKHYSSGMYVRLAFAVAAHLEPDILIVDEVLAVGDHDFQKKCLGKMEDASKEGRTVLFVSHNMGAVQRLCSRAVLLNDGSPIADGQTDAVVQQYLLMGMERAGERIWSDISRAPGNDIVRVRAIRVTNQFGLPSTSFDVRDPVNIELDYWVLKEGYPLLVQFIVSNALGQRLLNIKDNLCSPWSMDIPRPTGLYRTICHIPGDFLNEGTMFVSYGIDTLVPVRLPVHATEWNILSFPVSDRMDPGGVRGNYPFDWGPAGVRPRFLVTVERKPLEEATMGRAG
jgi:lipopolysaccharide transport system ATP-binding protein